MLASQWDTIQKGPARKEYSLTGADRECLWRWMQTLTVHTTLIGELFDHVRNVFPPEFMIIASHAAGEHRHRIMVRGDADMQTLTDLKGKQLGVKKGTSTYGGLLAALAQAGIGAGQIEIDIIDLTPPIMTDALLAGSLDAFAASEPTPSVAEQKGARELMALGGLGNEYPLLILARKKMLQHRRAAVDRFVRALKRAEKFVAEHPEETVKIMATLFLKKQQVIPKLPEFIRK